MKLKEPCSKKRFKKISKDLKLQTEKLVAEFNGFSVVMRDVSGGGDVINRFASFGKGNLSRGSPSQPSIVRRRVFESRRKWQRDGGGAKRKRKVIVISDSDEDKVELKPVYEFDPGSLQETLHLGLEEAFFCAFFLEYFQIEHRQRIVSKSTCFQLFCAADEKFPYRFAVYHYFRTRNWIVKPGLRFGGDFALYKDGPAFYHASYIVVIDDVACGKRLDVKSLIDLNRTCQAAGKEVLVCQVRVPNGWQDSSVEDRLATLNVNVVLLNRWMGNTITNR